MQYCIFYYESDLTTPLSLLTILTPFFNTKLTDVGCPYKWLTSGRSRDFAALIVCETPGLVLCRCCEGVGVDVFAVQVDDFL